jgi:hypothetical protein
MQLDKTHIKIRTRKASEIADLAMVMVRHYPKALTVAFLFGALPWIIANYALLAWIPLREADLGITDAEAVSELTRYRIWMAVLVFLQAPAAGIATTYYLGQAVFEEQPTWASVFREVKRRFWPCLFILGVVRLPLIAMGLLVFMIGQPTNAFVDIFVPILFVIAACVIRGSRPFMPEILLLEQCPIRSKSPETLTVRVRSSRLHSPLSAEVNARFVSIGIATVLFTIGLYYAFQSITTLLTGNKLNHGLFPLLVLYPAALWIAAGLSVILRLLNYLDGRIRLEGWDVELSVRAEAIRQFGDPTLTAPSATGANRSTKVGSALLVLGMLIAGSDIAMSQEEAVNQSVVVEQDTIKTTASQQTTPVSDSVWFDAESGKVRPIEVNESNQEAIHRTSRWLPKANRIKEAAQPDKSTVNSGGGGSGTVGNWLSGLSLGNAMTFLLLVLLVTAMVILFYKLLGRFDPDEVSRRNSSGKPSSRVIDDLMIERISQLPKELRRTDVDMRTEAERLMNEKQFDLAIILLLGHQLLLLDRAGMLRLTRGKTNGRYVSETRSKNSQVGNILKQTTRNFDQSFFGNHPLSQTEFAKVWADNSVLEATIVAISETAA